MTHLILRPMTTDSPECESVRSLYIDAFPACEREPFDHMMENEKGDQEFLMVYREEVFCGFIFLQNDCIQKIAFITYFAILPSMRGQGIGSSVLKALIEYRPGYRIIADLERETPECVNPLQRRSRKEFYLKQGFRETSVRYTWQGEAYELVSYGGEVTLDEYLILWDFTKEP